MQNLVISAVVKLVDQISAPLRGVTASVNKLGGTLGQSAAGLARWGIGLAGIAGAASAFGKIISATANAEKAVMEFDIAFKALGKGIGQTRQQLLAFSQTAQSRTIFDDESITRAQGALLRFRTVTGDTFVRARDTALDLASALGTDVISAANAVGRSLERPSMALRMLRQYGIVFSRDQEIVIRQLEKTGKTSEAAAIVLRELEGRFKGASDAARNTLDGALKSLKNSFDDLFEASDNGTALTKSINDLAKQIGDPSFKQNFTNLAALALDVAGAFVRLTAAIGNASDKLGDFIARGKGLRPQDIGKSPVETALSQQRALLRQLEIDERRTMEFRTAAVRRGEFRMTPEIEARDTERSRQIEVTRRLVAELEKQLNVQKKLSELTGVEVTGGRSGEAAVAAVTATSASAADAISEIVIQSAAKTKSATEALYDQWEESTRTTIQKQVADYERLISIIDELARAGRISQEDAAARTREVVDAALQEVELTSRKVNVAPAIDQAREAFMNFANSVGSSLGNAISQGGFEGMTTMRDIVKNTLRGILADILSSGIRKGLTALFDVFTGGGSKGGGGGFMSFITGAITNLFAPGKAGGGNVTGLKPFMVGEEGPELFMPSGSGRIVSTPSLAGASGGTVNYSPQTNITVTGNALDDKTKEELLAYIELGRARDQRQLSRIVTQNGLRGAR